MEVPQVSTYLLTYVLISCKYGKFFIWARVIKFPNKIFYILGQLCEADYEGISKWSFGLTIDDDSLLTESGKTELKELGQRYKARLSDLLDEPYNEENIIVKK